MFTPKPYRTWLELARQLEEFFRTLTKLKIAQQPLANRNYAVSYLTQDGRIVFHLSQDFLNERYIEFSPDVQTILGVQRFVFQVTDELGIDFNSTDGDDALYIDGQGFQGDFENDAMVDGNFDFATVRPLMEFDQRESIDVYSTFPLKSKVIVVDGEEEHEHILFRLPFAEQHSFASKSSFQTGGNMVRQMSNISENIDVGLTNMCDKHATVLHQKLLPGNIRNVQLRVMVRYKTMDGIVERDMDFKNGFWYVRLLFVKKV